MPAAILQPVAGRTCLLLIGKSVGREGIQSDLLLRDGIHGRIVAKEAEMVEGEPQPAQNSHN